MEILPLITIPTVYFAIAMLKPHLQDKLPFNLCAICISISCTWLLMLVLRIMNQDVPLLLVGILMGMSISGIMYKLAGFYKKTDTHNFWFIRVLIVIGGLYFTFQLLNNEWNVAILILIASFLLIMIASLFFQKTSHADLVKENRKHGRKSSLIKKLEDCC